MYAVIETGGKQYKVELGTELAVELLDVEPGQSLDFERVLLVADGQEAAIGKPLVDGARVTADVLRQDRADKVTVFKYRPKARRRVKRGHRQAQTVVRVSDIVHGSKSAAKLAEAARTERERLEAAAAEEASTRAAADRELAERLASASAERAAGEEAERPKTTRARRPGAPKATASTGAAPAAKKASAPKATAPKDAKGSGAKADSKPGARTQAPEPEAKPKPGPKTATKKED